MTQLYSNSSTDLDQAHAERKLIRTILLLFIGIRLVFAAMVQLLPDEATYWVWSRHLAASYFDHPPMVAYLIRAGTYLLGHNELGVRLGAVILSTATVVVMMGIAKRTLKDDRAAFWVGLIWLTSPLLAGIGLIVTPDTPMVFFSVCGLAVAIQIAEAEPSLLPRRWLLFGVFTGMALLSKYTAILLPGGVILALMTSSWGRVHFRGPWIYLAGLVALIIFSPVIWWNAKHQWVSFEYQLRHGTESDAGSDVAISTMGGFGQFWKDLGIYFGGQAGAFTPILFGVALFVLGVYWRRYHRLGDVDRVLLWSGTLPLVFFGAMHLKSHHSEANWPAFAYFPISLLIGRWMTENWAIHRLGIVRLGVIVSFGILVTLHIVMVPKVTERLVRLPYRLPHIFREAVVWRERGKALGRIAEVSALPVVANRHEEAAEAAFYMPGQPDVWCVGIGSRPTAYDYFDEQPNFATIPGVFWIGGHVDQFKQKYGLVEQSRTELMFFTGRNQTVLRTYVLIRPQR